MSTHTKHKGKSKKTLLRGVYYNVPSPVGMVKANVEVWLHVQIRVDPNGEDHGERGLSEGGDDRNHVLRGDREGELDELLNGVAERIAQLVETATPASASLEKVAQAELFEGMEVT